MLSSEAEAVLEFWFGVSSDDAEVQRQKGSLWWSKSDDLDRTIRERFGDLRERAKRGALRAWASEARGRLALIILLDQFSRNLFRGDPEAFAADAIALECALEGIASGQDQALRPFECAFMYMPLMHAEDVELQRRCVELFEKLRDAAPASLKKSTEGYVKFAEIHHDIVERFGRFPHRNAVLGRATTAEESAFLERPGSSF